MTLRKLLARTKPPANPGQKPATGEGAAEIERMKRQMEAHQKAAAKSAQEAQDAQKARAQAEADAARVRVESAVTAAAAKHRALNPAHVAQLVGGKVKVGEGGKLTVDGSDKDVDAYVGEWLSGEGKHFLPAGVPSGGSGAPSNPSNPQPARTYDLKTSEGMTQYARDREATAHRPGQAQRPALPAQQPVTPAPTAPAPTK